jgi:hypothetical protein
MGTEAGKPGKPVVELNVIVVVVVCKTSISVVVVVVD